MVSRMENQLSRPGDGYRYATVKSEGTLGMNGVEQNPYTPSGIVEADKPHQPGLARRVLLGALQSLSFAVLFCFSLLFLGSSVRHGVTEGWEYAIWFVPEYPFLTVVIVLSNAVLRRILLPRPKWRALWLPLLAGVVSFLSLNAVHSRVDSIIQIIIPPGSDSWTSYIAELLIQGTEPSFVGIFVEGLGHGVLFILGRKRSKVA